MLNRYFNMTTYIGLTVYVFCIFVLSFYMYYQSKSEIIENIDTALHSHALLIPLVIDTERIAPPARDITQRLSAFLSIAHLNFACQLQPKEDTLHTVVCVTTEGGAYTQRPYPYAMDDPLQAWHTGKPIHTTTEGRHGAVRSLFVPVSQSNGEIHILGVGRSLREAEALLKIKALESFGYGLIFPLFVLPLLYFANKNTRNAISELRIVNFNLARMNERYKELSYSDTLTDLPNRRAFYENGQRAVGNCLRTGRPLHVLALDLDHFKNINDTYGHSMGDTVLVGFAHTLRECLRTGDVVGRCGGEEFGVLLPETERQSAIEVAERLRAACAARTFMRADGTPFHVTVSVGVAQLLETEGVEDTAHTVGDMLNRVMTQADAALYQAKQQGRNKVCVYTGDA